MRTEETSRGCAIHDWVTTVELYFDDGDNNNSTPKG